MDNKQEFFEKAKKISEEIVNVVGQPDFTEELERQIFGAFVFGIINALAHEKKVMPIEVQAVMIEISVNTLQYTPNQAVEFCQYLINCTDKEYNPTTYAIIHKGIDGYFQLEESKSEELANNYNEITTVVNETV